MASQNHSPRVLLISAILVAFLLIIVISVAIFTRNISKGIDNGKNGPDTNNVLAPTQSVRSIYLDLPQTFPRDLPLPKLAKVTVASADEQTWNAVLSTNAALDETVSFYRKELPNTGWEITSQPQAAGITIFYAEKQGKEAIIAVGKGDHGNTVSITILKDTSQ